MERTKLTCQKLSLTLSLAWAVAGLTGYPTSVLAESANSPTNPDFVLAQSSSEEDSEEDIDFSWTGRPLNEQTDAASRGTCEGTEETELTALVPKTMGLTVSAHPTFWIYVPDRPENVRYAELVLQDEEEQRPIDRIRYALEKTPGIVSVSLPSTPQYFLKTGKIYRWYFRIVCNNGTNFAVGGLVQRATLDSSEHNYSGYLTNRIWHDALTDLAQRYRITPQKPQLTKEWANLLKTKGVGLERLARESSFGALKPITQ